MTTVTMSKLVRAVLLSGAILSTVAMANADLITADGDFGAQGNFVTLGAPWSRNPSYPGSQIGYVPGQSPFTNLFANNGIGTWIEAATGGQGMYIVQQASTNITSGLASFNVDFRNTGAYDAAGGYSLMVASNWDPSKRAAALYVTGSALYLEESAGTITKLLDVAQNTWYNVQLALDVTNQQFSGSVTQYGGATTSIASHNFIVTNHSINTIGSGGGDWAAVGGNLNDVQAYHNIDNFALSTVVPEPMSVVMLVIGLVGLLAYAWRKQK